MDGWLKAGYRGWLNWMGRSNFGEVLAVNRDGDALIRWLDGSGPTEWIPIRQLG